MCLPCTQGQCGFMGFHADRMKPPLSNQNVTFYLDTGDWKPYCSKSFTIYVCIRTCIICRRHYKITILYYTILYYPITLGGRRGTTDEFATIPFHLDLFSAALVELAKSIPVHSLKLSSHLFFHDFQHDFARMTDEADSSVVQLCQNYRTISLISHSSKVMLKVILNRLKPQAEEIIAEEQAGFNIQYQQNLYHVFIDFKKAFDSVWHAALWATMRKL